MSEVMPASREYRRTFAFAKNKLKAYHEVWAPNVDDDCCVECGAPEDIVEAYLAVRRTMYSMSEALQDHCGYDTDDILALSDKYEEEFYLPVLQEQALQERFEIYFEFDIRNRASSLTQEI